MLFLWSTFWHCVITYHVVSYFVMKQSNKVKRLMQVPNEDGSSTNALKEGLGRALSEIDRLSERLAMVEDTVESMTDGGD